MNKLAITTFALALSAAAVSAVAATITGSNNTSNQQSNPAALGNTDPNSLAPAANNKHKHHRHHRTHASDVTPVDKPGDTNYTEMRIGDPRIVYHEIGTAGAQRGNTIVPFFDEPIRSSKPYEIRYDYAEFKDTNNGPHKHWSW